MWYRNWRDPSWLAAGTEVQRAAWSAISETHVLEHLAAFDPVLAGTIPLDIDIPGSDLDIICCAPEAMDFATALVDAFGHQSGFQLKRAVIRDDVSTIAGFRAGGPRMEFAFEIFGQAMPVAHQPAIVHLDVEAHLLDAGGDEARRIIRALKASGFKTEPAFARWLGLSGDAYEALYALGGLQPADLAQRAIAANGSWPERMHE